MREQLTYEQQLEVMARCHADFRYALKFLRIVDKRRRVVPFVLNGGQKILLAALETNHNVKLLKARQFGGSTLVAAFYFWQAFWRPHQQVIVVTQSDKTAPKILSIYRSFWAHLPAWMREGTKVADQGTVLGFANGSVIMAGTASSESWRGSTVTHAHLTEVGHWDDFDRSVASIFQSVVDDGYIVLETTANGLNHWYSFWKEDNDYEAAFVGWDSNEEYASTEVPRKVPEELAAYLDRHPTLTQEQRNWCVQTFKKKCNSSLATLQQEYPLTPNEAFILQGQRFFNLYYEGVSKGAAGWIEYRQPTAGCVYSIGVDVAYGKPDGDFSAIVVLDVTEGLPLVAATYMGRVQVYEFGDLVIGAMKKWPGIAVIETNNGGTAVVERVVREAAGNVYRVTRHDRASGMYTEKLGFDTTRESRMRVLSKLQEAVSKGMDPTCPRLKHMMNCFQFGARGVPEATSDEHDDLVMAAALAVEGRDQTASIRHVVQSEHQPVTLQDLVQWEIRHGRPFIPLDKEDAEGIGL